MLDYEKGEQEVAIMAVSADGRARGAVSSFHILPTSASKPPPLFCGIPVSRDAVSFCLSPSQLSKVQTVLPTPSKIFRSVILEKVAAGPELRKSVEI